MVNLLDKFLELEKPEEITEESSVDITEETQLDNLNSPPKPVIKKPIKSSKIDFNKIANKAYFQRFIQNLMKDIMPEQFKGIDFRVSKDKAVEIFDNKISEIERGSKGAFNLVVKELKEKLAKQKEKVENGAN